MSQVQSPSDVSAFAPNHFSALHLKKIYFFFLAKLNKLTLDPGKTQYLFLFYFTTF